MNNKHRKTRKRIFETPVRKDVKYKDIENLLLAMGAEKNEGEGSRVLFTYENEVFSIHKPHPQKEVKAYVVKRLRVFINAMESES